ncbi:hypothetical protein CANARDRAFT_5853 [[Candida] arabinofermentans NRRL YB-2248]|uniref:RING-type domain-containing protein n=1 Tax=[Candida] arabinofermentans NRRL YB-2248 TaxID=983967 RepID=A0A1E4T6E8_9ASCO|nr:hypothetical protein CANARDRAFT_5853 [[Candida] arabinofermentans NRRL YB-2248]
MSKLNEDRKKYFMNSSGLLSPDTLEDLTASVAISFNSKSPNINRSTKKKNKNDTLLPAINTSSLTSASSLGTFAFPNQHPPPPPPPPHSAARSDSTSSSPTNPADISRKLTNLSRKFKNFGSPKTVSSTVNKKNVGYPMSTSSSGSPRAGGTFSGFAPPQISTPSIFDNQTSRSSGLGLNQTQHHSHKSFGSIDNSSTSNQNLGYKPTSYSPLKKSSITSTPSHQSTVDEHGRRKQRIATNCLFCELSLENVLVYGDNNESEKIYDLSCGHCCHEKCLLLEMELILQTNTDFTNSASYFPICPQCEKKKKAIPIGGQLVIDEFVTKIMLGSLHQHQQQFQNQNNNNVNDVSITPPIRMSNQFVSSSNFPSPTIQQRRRKSDSLTIVPPRDLLTNKHKKKPSRGSSISAISSIISSASNKSPVIPSSSNQSLPAALQNRWNSNFPLYLLKSKFTNELRQLAIQKVISESNVSDNKLDPNSLEFFGQLRLFDKLSSSEDGLNWCEYYCYLFRSGLLMIDLEKCTFYSLEILENTRIEVRSDSILTLKSLAGGSGQVHLSCKDTNVVEKWSVGLSNENIEFPSELITSTIKEDEFYDILSFSEADEDEIASGSTNNMKSAILPNGVNPRFYEATINSLIFRRKPSQMIIVINQLISSSHSLVSIRNIVKSLLLVHIDIFLIFTSTENLSDHTKVLDSVKISSKAPDDGNKWLPLDRIDEYQKDLNALTPRADKSPVSFDDTNEHHSKDELSNILTQHVSRFSSREGLDDITTVVLSGAKLKNTISLPTFKNVLIEISTKTVANSFTDNQPNVCCLANWDEAMEVICGYIGLEFDDSDFDSSSSSDESDDDDDENANIILAKGSAVDSEDSKDDVATIQDKREISALTTNSKEARWSALFDDLDKAIENTKSASLQGTLNTDTSTTTSSTSLTHETTEIATTTSTSKTTTPTTTTKKTSSTSTSKTTTPTTTTKKTSSTSTTSTLTVATTNKATTSKTGAGQTTTSQNQLPTTTISLPVVESSTKGLTTVITTIGNLHTNTYYVSRTTAVVLFVTFTQTLTIVDSSFIYSTSKALGSAHIRSAISTVASVYPVTTLTFSGYFNQSDSTSYTTSKATIYTDYYRYYTENLLITSTVFSTYFSEILVTSMYLSLGTETQLSTQVETIVSTIHPTVVTTTSHHSTTAVVPTSTSHHSTTAVVPTPTTTPIKTYATVTHFSTVTTTSTVVPNTRVCISYADEDTTGVAFIEGLQTTVSVSETSLLNGAALANRVAYDGYLSFISTLLVIAVFF